MSLKDSIKPISYLKANASKIIKDISNNGKTLFITQNGEAKVVVQDINEYEATQNSLNMLKILALSNKNIKDGKYKSLEQGFSELENRIKKFKREL